MEYKHLSHELGHTNKTPDTIAMCTHGRKHEWLARALPYLTLPYHICKVPMNQSGDSNPLSWVGSCRFCWVSPQLASMARGAPDRICSPSDDAPGRMMAELALLQNRLQVPIQPPNLVLPRER